ncbi:MAG: type II toxin-antitoxin system HicB family antitoxin [Alphaproteobacteria bacterium]|jgi:antitoxin HicB|nr:type II toxin-antitoxin system HicB family antitoxin [Alphaproteobacteria bacterium]
MLSYPITTEPDDGTLLIRCPDLPEVVTFAELEAEIEAPARDAIEEALAARISHGEDIPKASAEGRMVSMGVTTTLKVRLYQELRAQGKTRADLMRALGWSRNSVDRLFRIGHASKTDQLEAALAALGKRVTIGLAA